MFERAPLSQAQLGLWLGHAKARDASCFNAAECVLIHGDCDPARLSASVAGALREAAALHVSFREHAGIVECRPRVSTNLDVPIVEAPGDADPASRLRALAWSALRRPFALERDLLVRHFVVRLGPGLHAWVHVAHHIVLDGFGFSLFARRVAQLYGASVGGPAAPPPWFTELAPVLQEDLDYQRSPALAEDRSFWASELHDHPPLRPLASTAPPSHALRQARSIDADALARLGGQARAEGLGWPEVATAIVAEHVAQGSGADRFSLGIPSMQRLGTAALKTPCMAMNMFGLPTEVRPGEHAFDRAHRIQEAFVRSEGHRRYRYERVRMDRGASLGPVVNIMPFDLSPSFGGARAELVAVSAGPVEDLSITLASRGAGLELRVDGHPGCWSTDGLETFTSKLASAIETFGLPRSPRSRPRGDAAWTDAWPPCALARHAAARPEAPALVGATQAWSYAALHHAVLSLAARLRARGCRPGDIVGVGTEDRAHGVIAVLAAMHVGVGAVGLESTLPRARRDAILSDAGIRLVVTEEDFSAPEDTAASPQAATVAPDPDALAYIVYTSGSSGTPKGVELSAAGLSRFLDAATARYGVEHRDRLLHFAGLGFDACLEEIGVALRAGATLVCRPPDLLESMESLLVQVATLGVTVLDLPTAVWHELALALDTRGLQLPAAVRTVIIGGEAASADRVNRFLASAPSVRLVNTYGPSEATIVATSAVLRPGSSSPPIGTPLPPVRAWVVDERGDPVTEPEVAGELWLGGSTLARGYRHHPDLTAERFVVGPDGQRAYRTGDRVHWRREGDLAFEGRVDDERKVAGHRVTPGEIEAVLTRHHAVTLAAAHVHGDPPTVRADVEACAEVDPDELRAFASAWLPAVLVPRRVRIHARLPRTHSGKIDRARLVDDGEPVVRADVDDPALERVLACWRALLGVEELGPDDDFFAKGGDSMALIQLANRLSDASHEVRVTDLFRLPTPRGQVELLRAPGRTSPAPPFEPRPVDLGRFERASVQGDPHRWLVTGATGFVGIHVVRAILARTDATAICVVRAPNQTAALLRLRRHAEAHGVSLDPTRVEVVAGDLFDVSTGPCGVIVHGAAEVSVTRSYDSLFRANVLGTAEILRQAARWGSAVHVLSTVATLPAMGDGLEDFVPVHAGLGDGYTRSKWHAELLAREAAARGVCVAVHRLPRVAGPRFRPSIHAADLLWQMVDASLHCGHWPDVEAREPWVPADDAAAAVVDAIVNGAATTPASCFHVVHTGAVELSRIERVLASLGAPLERVPMARWLQRLAQHDRPADAPLRAFFDGRPDAFAAGLTPALPDFSRLAALVPDLQPRPIDDDLLAAYCRCALARTPGRSPTG